MASNHKNHIDIEQLRKYYAGELSEFQRNALEQKALDDPFLKEAMDGFDENPDSFNQFYSKNKTRLIEKRGYTFLIGAITLALLFTITFVRKQLTSQQAIVITNGVEEIATHTEIDYEENFDAYEIIPRELDTLHTINFDEIITYEEIKTNKAQIETPPIITEPKEDKDTFITVQIDDPISLEDDFTLEEENLNNHKHGSSVSSKYLYNLYTIDYTSIRSNHEVKYTRFEMGGISADQEGRDDTSDLISSEVEIPYFIYLRKSMESFSKNQYKRALNRYLTILDQYPEDLNGLFYGGLCYFNLGKYEKAFIFFEKIETVDLDGFQQEARWYKVKSLIKLNQISAAKEELDLIIMQGGFYVKDAIELKNEL